MYAARINGGSVENEFSAAANNKEGGREGERRVEGDREKRKRDEARPFRATALEIPE